MKQLIVTLIPIKHSMTVIQSPPTLSLIQFRRMYPFRLGPTPNSAPQNLVFCLSSDDAEVLATLARTDERLSFH